MLTPYSNLKRKKKFSLNRIKKYNLEEKHSLFDASDGFSKEKNKNFVILHYQLLKSNHK